MNSRLLPLAFRPYIFRELPLWGKIYQWVGAGGKENTNPLWRNAPTRIVRGKAHGYLMDLDLSDDMDRMVYFLGRYYDLDLQLLLDELLRPGDTFINVGANAGYVVLHAASRVGPQGRVIAFEPQPGCCQKLRRNLELNGIEHVDLHDHALGERDDTLELKMLGGTSIMSTLCIDETDVRALRDRIEVPVRRGDDVVSGRVIGNLTLMVDVEGFEVYVLRGLDRTIAQYRPPILLEVVPRYLRRRAPVSTSNSPSFMIAVTPATSSRSANETCCRYRNRSDPASGCARSRRPMICTASWICSGCRRRGVASILPRTSYSRRNEAPAGAVRRTAGRTRARGTCQGDRMGRRPARPLSGRAFASRGRVGF